MNYANPVLVYAVLWSTILLLHSMRLIEVLIPINGISILLVLSNIIIFYMIYTLNKALAFTYYKKHPAKSVIILIEQEVSALENYSRRLFPIWIIGTLINILYSGGVPLYWMVTGSDLDYTNYGIPTFGGFIAAINAFLAVSYFIIYLNKPKPRTLIMIMIQLAWPLLVISRGNFTYILLEIVGAYLLLRRSNLKTMFVSLLGFAVFVYLFGLIGDYRMGDKAESFKKGLMNPEYFEIADLLPSGILYVYAYITTPFNNIVFNINSLEPTFMPFYSTVFLFPTIVRGFIFNGSGNYPFVLVSEAFNTVTFYAGYLMDFGVIVTIIIVSVIQFGASTLYLRALKGNIAYIIAYSVAFQCICLSIFSDNFTMYMSIFQIFLAFHFGRLYKRRCREKKFA